MAKRKRFYKRLWLNRRGTAFLEIDDDIVSFGDCSRIVRIEFYTDPEVEDSNKDARLAKLNRIIDALLDYRIHFEDKGQ